ncbi:hypothetical protein GJ496_006722 [Pomphorhynchus laevis]|nr:hypothetical protein GJ496_006722 [Pomphorhynchus laevis]
MSDVCSLPFRHGGIGISDPNDMAYVAYRSSLEICGPFMSDTEGTNLSSREAELKLELKSMLENYHLTRKQQIISQASTNWKCILGCASNNGASSRAKLSIAVAKTASMCLRRPIREPLSIYHRTENTNEYVDQYQLARGQAQLRQKEVVHQVETLEWTGDGDDN